MAGSTGHPLYIRPYSEIRAMLMERGRQTSNPIDHAPLDEVQAILDRLDSVGHDPWAEAFSAHGERHFAAARELEAVGNTDLARREYRAAYSLFRIARYPAPNSPGKKAAYRRSQDAYLKAAAFGDMPVTRVEMPYVGAQAKGAVIVGYLHRPRRDGTLPVVVQWGGIDSFKEERRPGPYLAAGFAVLAVDMPGVADAPIPGSETGEELWNGIFDWIAMQPMLDPKRIVLVGGSTGGYWATKLAHTHRDRIAAAVNHGGPAHFAFQHDWIMRAARGEYPFELAETLACAFGRKTATEWIGYAPHLSLLEQGILDKPCAPLLCVNGVEDSVFPIEDMYLLLQHGGIKAARFFPGGHMGHSPDLFPQVVTWLTQQIAQR
jgi:esterase FrsA